MAYPTFPDLYKAPDISMKETFDDPGIKDKMEDGTVATRPRYTRMRKTLKVTYSLLTPEARRILIQFMRDVGSWQPFYFIDNRDDANPETLTMRFTKLPEISDDKWAGGSKRFKADMELTEI